MKTTDRSCDQPEKQFAAVCGLFCPGCSVYIATIEDPERLARIARSLGLEKEDVKCHGCRADVRAVPCRSCGFVACAADREVEFCAQCADFPCEDLKRFQAEMPHRADLFEDGRRIREAGCKKWFREAFQQYTCRQCGTINSAYDLACRRCRSEPGSSFAERHWEAIYEHLSKVREREADV